MTKKDSIINSDTDTILKENSPFMDHFSLFSGHSLPSIHHKPIFNSGDGAYWQGILLFSIFSIYVFVKISEPKKLIRIIQSAFSIQDGRKLFREEIKLTKNASVFLGISFVLIMSFLAFFVNQYFGMILHGYSSLKQYWFFLSVLSLMYLIKFLTNYILTAVSSSKALGREYFFNVILFAYTAGIVLFPLITCLQFTRYPKEWFLYPAMMVAVGFYIVRIFRGFIISVTEQNIGILNIFLYICAMEILPLLVLVKLLIVNF